MSATVPLSLADMIQAEHVVSAHPDYIPNQTDLDTASRVFEITTNDINVIVFVHADDSAFLYWNDGVANEWCEHYPSLAYAYGRLALLQACAESAWEKGFVHSPRTFVKDFDTFMRSAI